MMKNAKTEWLFRLGEAVALSLSGERGIVIGRAEYLEGGPSYLVRYHAGDGRQVEGWWNEPAIDPIAAARRRRRGKKPA